jgi:hypothetical protein
VLLAVSLNDSNVYSISDRVHCGVDGLIQVFNRRFYYPISVSLRVSNHATAHSERQWHACNLLAPNSEIRCFPKGVVETALSRTPVVPAGSITKRKTKMIRSTLSPSTQLGRVVMANSGNLRLSRVV